MEVIPPQDFQFEFATGFVHTTPEWMARVEAGEAPRNLLQLRELGRLMVLGATAENQVLIPLKEVLLEPEHQTSIKASSNKLLSTRDWYRDDFINYGRWLDAITRDPGEEFSKVGMPIIKRAHKLGLGASDQAIRRSGRGTSPFTSLPEFYEACDFIPIQHRYAAITKEQLADYAEDVLLFVLSQPSKKDSEYRNLITELALRATNGEGPSINVFKRVGGSVMKVLESKGYIEIRNMQPRDYYRLGWRFKLTNGADPTPEAFDFLAKTKRTPLARHIQEKFGWDAYLKGVRADYEKEFGKVLRSEARKTKQDVTLNKLPAYVIDRNEPQDIVFRRAKWMLVNELLPKLDQSVKKLIVTCVDVPNLEMALSTISEVDKYDIRDAASNLKIVEDLWPTKPQAHWPYLKVPKELLSKAQRP